MWIVHCLIVALVASLGAEVTTPVTLAWPWSDLNLAGMVGTKSSTPTETQTIPGVPTERPLSDITQLGLSAILHS